MSACTECGRDPATVCGRPTCPQRVVPVRHLGTGERSQIRRGELLALGAPCWVVDE